MGEFRVTHIAKTAMHSFLIAAGIPSENMPQIMNVVFGLASDVVEREMTLKKPEIYSRLRKPKGIDYV